MGEETEKQQDEMRALEVQIRLKKLNHARSRKITQEWLAERLRVSQGELSKALNGERPALLDRIIKRLDAMERKKNEQVAA